MAVGVTPGELRELTDDELKDRLRESKEELFNLRFQMATGQLANNRRLRTVRQEIARVYTVLRERELGLASGPVMVEEFDLPERVRKPDPTHVRAARCTRARSPDAPPEADGCWPADRSPSGSEG